MPADQEANPNQDNDTEAAALEAQPPPYTFAELTDFLLAHGVPKYALDAVQTIQLTTTPVPSTKYRGADVQVVALVTYYPSPTHQDLGENRGEALYHSNYYLLHQPTYNHAPPAV